MISGLTKHPVNIEKQVQVISLKVVFGASKMVEEEVLQIVREMDVIDLFE